jgi:hypothetical protein
MLRYLPMQLLLNLLAGYLLRAAYLRLHSSPALSPLRLRPPLRSRS